MEKNREDQVAVEIHSRINEFHDKFSPQLEIVSSDPGRFLAWLVLLSTLLTLLLGHIVYLSVFFLLYITWAYTDHIDREASSKDINKDSDENEWLLDKFMCFLQQLDNESFDLDLPAIPCEVCEVESSAEAEFETEDSVTTCSVVSDESDSLAKALRMKTRTQRARPAQTQSQIVDRAIAGTAKRISSWTTLNLSRKRIFNLNLFPCI